jgi:membrane-associated protease RseP (regulator of RpoE activity)
MDLGILITIAAILIYIILLVVLKIKGVFREDGLSLWGPFLMWRTERGKKLIEKIAQKRRFWRAFGNVAIGINLFIMILLMFFLIWAATLVPSIPRGSAPDPQLLIGLPGVNPIIPIWYGILGLAVAIVMHEFAHGILTRVANLKVKSLGIIACVVPIGAFVEPDEEQLKATEKKKRMRIFAAGPASNIIFALICAIIFSWVFMGSLQPVSEGILVSGALRDSPGDDAGLDRLWMEITEINGSPIQDTDDFQNINAPRPLENTTVTYLYNGEFKTVSVISGVVIIHVSEDYPGEKAGIETGMIFLEVNETEIRNGNDFQEAMKLTKPGQSINISLYQYNDTINNYDLFNTSATLEDKYEYYKENYPPYLNEESFKNVGFLGVSTSYLGVKPGGNPKALSNMLAHPFSNLDSPNEGAMNMITYILLPFQGLSPFPDSLTQLYEVQGPLSVLPSDMFWILANIFYWLFWLDLMLGMTNALPAVPMDGGHIFKDTLDGIIKRVKSGLDEKKREQYVRNISYTLAFFVLFLFIWQLLGPRIL